MVGLINFSVIFICSILASYAADPSILERHSGNGHSHLNASHKEVFYPIKIDWLANLSTLPPPSIRSYTTTVNEFLVPYSPDHNPSSVEYAFAEVLYRARECAEEKDKNRLLIEAANLNHPVALREFARQQLGVNAGLYIRSMAKAALFGDAEALYDLSVGIETWRDVLELPNNLRLARDLCQEAANLGNKEAERSLAMAHLDGGYGFNRDFDKGIAELKRIAVTNELAQQSLKSLDGMTAQAYYEGINS